MELSKFDIGLLVFSIIFGIYYFLHLIVWIAVLTESWHTKKEMLLYLIPIYPIIVWFKNKWADLQD